MDHRERGRAGEWKRGRQTRRTRLVLGTKYLALSTQLLVGTLAFALPTHLDAQTLLRWKLKPGDAFTVETRQETDSQVAFSGKSATTKIDLALQLTWVVTAANENEIVIKQSIDA